VEPPAHLDVSVIDAVEQVSSSLGALAVKPNAISKLRAVLLESNLTDLLSTLASPLAVASSDPT
jgi:hypothetical protein